MIIPQGVSSKVKDKTNDYILDVENLVVRYETEDGVVNALNGFDLKLKYKQTIGLVGETGAGKTTAALAILRLVPDPPGVVECSKLVLDGRDILELPNLKMDEVRGKDMSMIFQDPMTSLNPVFTVGEQIAESLEIHEGLSQKEALEKAQEMLELVGIPKERHNEYPHQFSGGMKQRVVIAVALACNPKLLIADEPTTALDVTIQAQVLELMNDLKMKYDTSIIMITHDLGIVAEVCDDVMVMYAGRIVEQGTLEDIFSRTMHPYTEGLFNSIPNIRNRQRMLKPIQGLMPDPMDLPAGCSFASRCNYASEDCTKAVPELRTVSDTHKVRCVAYDRPGFQIERGRS
ncbi:MAG TPA: ABC transporter ATP-binding protein [Limnochordia bacterium]|nr:ABC transporter ATP-binding protein [Limnochordia bacterium]